MGCHPDSSEQRRNLGTSRIDDPDDSKWFNIVDTNLNGMYLITKEVLKQMPDHHGGRVINISSVLGKFGVPGYTAYCTTKHGMISGPLAP